MAIESDERDETGALLDAVEVVSGGGGGGPASEVVSELLFEIGH